MDSKDYILLTGGAGFIGTHTAYELLKNGDNVIIFDNFGKADITPETHLNIKGLIKLHNQLNNGSTLIIKKKDLCNIHDIANVFSQYKVVAVIHFAALKSVNESIQKPSMYYENNITGMLNLLKVMKTYECNYMIFSSSATVYGSSEEYPFKENSPIGVGITNPYGRTKLMCEEILKDYVESKEFKNLKVISLRYFNPVGADHSGLIGEIPNGYPNNLFPYILEVASGAREKLEIFGGDYDTPDGTCIRDFIHVSDLAEGHLRALQHMSSRDVVFLERNFYNVYNLGTGKGTSVLEFINTFMKTNNVEINYNIVDRRPGDVKISYADVSKAENFLRWKAKRNIEDVCRDGWNFYITLKSEEI